MPTITQMAAMNAQTLGYQQIKKVSQGAKKKTIENSVSKLSSGALSPKAQAQMTKATEQKTSDAPQFVSLGKGTSSGSKTGKTSLAETLEAAKTNLAISRQILKQSGLGQYTSGSLNTQSTIKESA
ncbi:MAG: hypothetical protein PHV34_21460 [Verrucomicrobiae bacterium]|nr:hypothetical protein [Verrucomicrobiae bacterium]